MIDPAPTLRTAAPVAARRHRRLWAFGALLLAALSALACGTLGYGFQALAGGAGILARREPIERLLRRGDLPARERETLELALALRDFSIAELALPDNRSYRSYVRLGRKAVTWNVIAAPRLSVEPVTWCFPIAGCVSYRGYFEERSAHRFAAKLAAQGDDVTIQGAAAYSTLGWFADPVLDTFLDDEPWRVAALLFHELAHQVAYAPGDTAFNESFATAVEELGVERWLATRSAAEREAYARDREQERRFHALLLGARAELAAVYAGGEAEAEKLARKRATLERLGTEIAAALDDGRLGARFEPWRGHRFNNADLAAIADYALWVPALRALFGESGGFAAFYREAKAVSELDAATREARLRALASGPATDTGDS